jgi:hypothetical protein
LAQGAAMDEAIAAEKLYVLERKPRARKVGVDVLKKRVVRKAVVKCVRISKK